MREASTIYQLGNRLELLDVSLNLWILCINLGVGIGKLMGGVSVQDTFYI